MVAPIEHMLRNSVAHGIEAPDVRLAAGKNEEGTIRLSAEHRGGRIVIEPVREDELAMLVDAITPANLHGEVSFGAAAGKEAF